MGLKNLYKKFNLSFPIRMVGGGVQSDAKTCKLCGTPSDEPERLESRLYGVDDKKCTTITTYSVKEKAAKLPFVNQAADLKARLILSQGLDFKPTDPIVAGDTSDRVQNEIKKDLELINEIFTRENGLGQNLLEINQNSIVESELFGRSGIQVYDFENPSKIEFQPVKWDCFFPVTNKLKADDKGRKVILYYIIDHEGKAVTEKEYKNFVNTALRYKVLPEGFIHYRLNNTEILGRSPLANENLMSQLIIDSLEDNIETVNNNGWKGVVLKGVKGMNPADYGLRSDVKPENWRQEVTKKILRDLKKSIMGRDNRGNLVHLDGSAIESMEQLERGFNPLDYLKFVESNSPILAASLLGIHAALLGVRDTTYAANIGEAVKFAVNYSIAPSQLKYAEVLTGQVLNRYINNYTKYNYRAVYRPIDLSDPKVEAETYNLLGNFVKTIRESAVASINESVDFVNKKVDDISLKTVDDPVNESGDLKTTPKPLQPVHFEDIEDTP